MKKLLLLLIISTLSFRAFSQNDCADIKKSYDDLQGITTYQNTISEGSPLITISKMIGDHSFFSITFIVWDKELDLNRTGLFIKFNDGSVIRLPNQVVHGGAEHGSLGYSYTTHLTITRKNIKKLTSKYITKFGVGDIEMNVPKNWGIKYMHYIKCIKGKTGI